LRPEVFRSIVGGNYEHMVLGLEVTKLCFSKEGVAISPDLEVMREAGTLLVEVVKDDMGLVSISIPPFILAFYIGVRKGTTSIGGFTRTRRSIDPESSYVRVIIGREL